MWRNFLPVVFYSWLILFSTFVLSSQNFTNIYEAYNQAKYIKALQIADSLFDEHAGTPEFDKIYGAICLKLNKIDEAVFAFERAISQNPEDYQSLYFLALSYAKQRNYIQSEQVLNALLSLELTPSLKANIIETLRLVKTNTQKLESNISNKLSVYFGNDSNVNSGALDDRVVVSGLEILLDEESLTTSDQFVRYSYELRGKWNRTQYDSWLLDFNIAQQSHQSLSQYNRTNSNLNFGYEYGKLPFKINVNSFLSVMALDEASYQQEFGFHSNLQYQFNKMWLAELTTKFSKVNNVENDNLDSDIFEAGLSVIYLGKRFFSKYSFISGEQKANLELAQHFGRDYLNHSLYLVYTAQTKLSFFINAQKKQIEHHAMHPFFLILRDEDQTSLSIGANYTLSNHWQLNSKLSHYDKISNIQIYEYDRLEWYIGASYEF